VTDRLLVDVGADGRMSVSAWPDGEAFPNPAGDVEAALHARGSTRHPQQYLDPISLASLIVSVATLAWTVYTDLKNKTPNPSPTVVARTIRVRLSNDSELDPAQRDRIIEVVVDETFQAAQSPN
jgi:hypothetical protein